MRAKEDPAEQKKWEKDLFPLLLKGPQNAIVWAKIL